MNDLRELFRIFSIIIVMGIHIYILFRQNTRNGTVTTHSAVMVACILYYGVIPVIAFSNESALAVSKTVRRIAASSDFQFFAAEFAILLFTVAFQAAYRHYNNKRKLQIYTVSERRMTTATSLITWVTLIVGGLSFVLYIRAFGGVERLLHYADYLRSFSTSATSKVSYFASILVIPARLITVTPIVIMPLLMTSKGQKRLIYFVVFVISLMLAVLFVFANAGKIPIITMLLCFTLPIAQRWFKHPWLLMIICACCAFPLLGVLDSLFSYLQTGIWEAVSTDPLRYISAFSHPYSNVLHMEDIVDKFGLRWGSDYFTGILNILPGVSFQPSYEVTSEFYGGTGWRLVGGVPNDIITFGYLQFGLAGVVLQGILLGIACGKIDRLLKQLSNQRTYAVLSTAVIVNTFCYVVDADIASLVSNQFVLTMSTFCILYACHLKQENNQTLKRVI